MVWSIIPAFVLTVALAGCGEPVRNVGDDAKAAKEQAQQAAQAAEEAAKRADELSRLPLQQAQPAGEPERHE
jgi:hypothetical protein